MTHEELFSLADKVGLGFIRHASDKDIEKFEAFAKLVAQHEREKFIDMLRMAHDSLVLASDPGQLKERGTK